MRVRLRCCIMEFLGLLFALLGFTTLMAFPARWPLEPRERRLVADEASCLDKSSKKASLAYVDCVAPGRPTPRRECIILTEQLLRFGREDVMVCR